jgi:hypothetical protein
MPSRSVGRAVRFGEQRNHPQVLDGLMRTETPQVLDGLGVAIPRPVKPAVGNHAHASAAHIRSYASRPPAGVPA